MHISVRRRRILQLGLSLGLAAGLVGFAVLALPAIFYLVNFVDPEDSVVYFTLAATIGAPFALVLLWHAWKSLSLNPRAACRVCNLPLGDCLCCAACEGSGETPTRVRSENWLAPTMCLYCMGTGDERPDKRGPGRMALSDTRASCCRCGAEKFGRYVPVVRLLDLIKSGGPAYELHQYRFVDQTTAFLCVDCGKGCRNKAEAENAAARALTERQQGLDKIYVYWGETGWEAARKAHKS